METTQNGLQAHEAAAAAKGHRVFRFSGIQWFSLAPGEPVKSWWGETISKAQHPRVEQDKAAVDRLAVGQSVTVVRGFHPRHGDKTTTVTRVA